MRLTRKKSIELCIELWTWLAETGKCKVDYVITEEQANYCVPVGSEPYSLCWFCEYGYQRQTKDCSISKCHYCPISDDVLYGCIHVTIYGKWERAKQTRTRKKYAKLFLAQIKALK